MKNTPPPKRAPKNPSEVYVLFEDKNNPYLAWKASGRAMQEIGKLQPGERVVRYLRADTSPSPRIAEMERLKEAVVKATMVRVGVHELDDLALNSWMLSNIPVNRACANLEWARRLALRATRAGKRRTK